MTGIKPKVKKVLYHVAMCAGAWYYQSIKCDAARKKGDRNMTKEQYIEALQVRLGERKEQLAREPYNSYNHGWVAGEVSGIRMAIEILQEFPDGQETGQ